MQHQKPTAHQLHHWHHVYKKRRRVANISARQIMLGQALALCGSLLAGYILELNKASLTLFAGAFLLLPGVVDLAASITGAMCAKINHSLEKGAAKKLIVTHSIVFAMLLSLTCGIIVGTVGGTIGILIFNVPFLPILLLAVATMLTVGFISYPCMSLLTLMIRRVGADPDNIIGPLETGFTDALTAFTVAMLVRLLS